jgi:hypothetical protein
MKGMRYSTRNGARAWVNKDRKRKIEMRGKKETLAQLLSVGILLLSIPVNIHAWEPNARDLDAAVGAGDFGGYFANISAWLDQKTPADPGKISEAAMADLI